MKNFFDISQYSDRGRKILFASLAGFLILVVGLAMFVISPLAAKNQNIADGGNKSSGTSATQAPVVPDDTETPLVTPTANPDSADQQRAEEQSEIAKRSEEYAKAHQDEHADDDDDPDIPNADVLKDTATKGVLAYCVINPGETTDQRKTKMAPYFHSDNSDYMNPAELYYQRNCDIEAVDGPAYNSQKQAVVTIGVAWSGVFSASDKAADAGYTQYSVVVDKDGIVSIDD